MEKVSRRETVVSHVYKELRRAIFQGRISCGERLIETELAEKLGVSRTPVREVISKLEAEGLVSRLGTGGVVVEDISSELEEIYDLRMQLEGFAARLVCKRASQEELDELEKICRQATEVIEHASINERSLLDRKFHLFMASISHSKRLLKLIEEYYEYSFIDPNEKPYNPELIYNMQNGHMDIVKFLQNRDPDKAEEAVRKHLSHVFQLIQAPKN